MSYKYLKKLKVLFLLFLVLPFSDMASSVTLSDPEVLSNDSDVVKASRYEDEYVIVIVKKRYLKYVFEKGVVGTGGLRKEVDTDFFTLSVPDNICGLNSDKFVYATGQNFYILNVDSPNANGSKPILFVLWSHQSPFISISLVKDTDPFFLIGVSHNNEATFQTFSIDGNLKNTINEGSVNSNSIACITRRTSPFVSACFRFNQGDGDYAYYILYDSNMNKIIGDKLNAVGLDPYYEKQTKGMRALMMGDTLFLLCMLKNEDSKIYFYCATGNINDSTISRDGYKSETGTVNRFATSYPCQDDIKETGISFIKTDYFATVCRNENAGSFFSLCYRYSSGSTVYLKCSIKNLEITPAASYPTIVQLNSGIIALLYNNDKKSMLTILNGANCVDASFQGRVGSKGTFDLASKVSGGLSVFDNYSTDIKVGLYGPNNDIQFFSVQGSTQTQIDVTTSQDFDSSQTFSYLLPSSEGTFTYSYFVSQGGEISRFCDLTFEVLPCHRACRSCTELGRSDEDTKCDDSGCASGYAYAIGSQTLCYSTTVRRNHIFYNTVSGNFESCHDNCLTCDEAGTEAETNCLTCDDTGTVKYYPLEEKTSQCHQDPVNGYFLDKSDPTNKKFVKCAEKCLTCTSLNVCTSCNGSKNYYPIVDQSGECWNDSTKGSNYFLNYNREYERCYTGCSTCSEKGTGKDNTQCTACDTDYYPLEGNTAQCYSEKTKPRNFFLATDAQGNKYYEKCYTGCLECSKQGVDQDNTNCVLCDQDKGFLVKEGNTSTDEKICYSKDTKPSNYFLNYETYQTEKCNDACATCNSKGTTEEDTQCLECAAGYAKFEETLDSLKKTDLCRDITKKEAGYIYDPNTNSFVKCDVACKECTGKKVGDNTNCKIETTGGTTVTYCSTDYYPIETDLTTCYYEYEPPLYYYLDTTDPNNKVFKKCYAGCLTCSEKGTDDDHMKCADCDVQNQYYPLEDDFSQCYSEATKPTRTYVYKSSEIRWCYDGCNKCDQESADDNPICLECNTSTDNNGPFYPIHLETQQKYKFCINDDATYSSINGTYYYYNSEKQEFYPCDSNCQICDGMANNCGTCDETQKLYLIYNADTDTKKCILEEEKPRNYYLEKYEDLPWEFLECNSRCETCEYGSTHQDHPRCTRCSEAGYVIDPSNSDGDCIPGSCPDGQYLYLYNGAITCADSCPPNYPYVDPIAYQCLENCNSPKYIYNNKCLPSCPDYTYLEDITSRICLDLDECKREDSYISEKLEDIPSKIDGYGKEYCENYKGTDKHVSVLNEVYNTYSLTIFKNEECASSIGGDLTMLSLANCPSILREKYQIPDNSPLITLKLSIPREGSTIQVSYAFYNSITCERLNLTYCKEEKVTIKVPMNTTTGVNITEAKEFDQLGIDVYNSSDPFFNDICFRYKAENGQDVTLEDRRKEFFQNVSFCEEGCDYAGVNLTSEEAICNCEIKTSFLSDILDNPLTGDFLELIEAANFEVLQCYKNVFKPEYLLTNAGHWILLTTILVQLVFLAMYIKTGIMPIRIYLLQYIKVNPPVKKSSLTRIQENTEENASFDKRYFEDIKEKNYFEDTSNQQESPSYFLSKKTSKNKIIIMSLNNNFEEDKSSSKELKDSNDFYDDRGTPKHEKALSKVTTFSDGSAMTLKNKVPLKEKEEKKDKIPPIMKMKFRERNLHKSVRHIIKKGEKPKVENKLNGLVDKPSGKPSDKPSDKPKNEYNGEGVAYNFESIEGDFDFSDGELNQLEMEDAAQYDKRPFCVFYWQQVQEQQEIIATFVYPNELDLLPIRSIYYFFKIGLYFSLSGLFYKEEQISKRYYSDGKENFLSFALDEFVRCIYSSMVALMVNFVVGILTSSRSRLEMLIKRERDPEVFRQESIEAVHSIRVKNIIFLTLNFTFMLVLWYFISAFCSVYPNTQKIWLIGTFGTWAIVQVFPFIFCFLIAALRYMGMRWKIEGFYNISICLAE